MPGRIRQPSALPAAVELTEPNRSSGLRFNEALSWRAGKAIPVADLLSRLQKLSKELRNLEQEQVDRAIFTKVAQELGDGHLLGHKDRGVRAWTVSCVVDLLRLCAPDAPFKNSQLKDIFTVIITSILPAIADPSNAYNAQHLYILKLLAETKSIILLTDVDNPDSLILPLFTTCFDVISGSATGSTVNEIEKAVEYHMGIILTVVIDEVAVLPQDVIDIIISQFLRVDPRTTQSLPGKSKKHAEPQDDKQATLSLKDYPPAYNTAKAICTGCPEKMTSQISQYFNNVIVDASAVKQMNGHSKHGGRRASNFDDSDDEAEDVKELSKAHQLIRELWRACPDVLLNVIPQLEAELSAESVSLRLLATETLGDVASGIGVSGPPPPAMMDPAAYPPYHVSSTQAATPANRLLVPMSPKPFSMTHASAYASFLSRGKDRSPAIRAAWTTAIGRILLTAAGGIGFGEGEMERLVAGLAQALADADEKVRVSAIKAIESFGYADAVNKLGVTGGISKEGSVMAVLSDRVKDRRHPVREEAMKTLGRLWGVASGDIEAGVEEVISIFGDAPRKMLDAYYTNDADIHALLDEVVFEKLLPLSFPPIKVKTSRSESQKQKMKEKEDESQEGTSINPDTVRVRRILTLVRSLDEKSRAVFYAMQNRQVGLAKAMTVFLKSCEDYNGGVIEGDEEAVKTRLTKVIDLMSKPMPDPSRVSADLWKLAKLHDRRNYQLIRYAMAAESDYRTVTNAIREFKKRVEKGPSGTNILDTFTSLLYRCSLIIYNRSHVPAIMEISRTDENGLAETAHEVLKEISTRNPEILKTHVQEMCKDLEARAPTSTKPEDLSITDTLKACAAFARKLPGEIPKDRHFLIAMTNYALYAQSPRAAKHAVSIIMAAADKKEMYFKDLVQKAVKDCNYGSRHFLARLATIAQLTLLAPASANLESDAIIKIALTNTLLQNRRPSIQPDAYTWSASPDEETCAKEWALKIMVNRCLSEEDRSDSTSFAEVASSLYAILNKLIANEGELLPSNDTPADQKSRLRLTATRLLLKLCSKRRRCEELVTAALFNVVALVAHDRLLGVRRGFVKQLKKYLGQNRLHHRWLAILFLLAFEPDTDLKTSTVTWLKSRVQFYKRQQQAQVQGNGKSTHQNVIEIQFAHLLSLLAHHPDVPLQGSIDYNVELVDYARYILFYLSAVGNEENLSLIFHIAQRVKQTKDGIIGTAEASEHLYILSDLAQATIRNFADVMSHQKGHAANVNILQTWPGKLRLPSTLFAALPNHAISQEIADKNFLPEEVAEELERLTRAFTKPGKSGQNAKSTEKKRRSDPKNEDEDDEKPAKKAKKAASLPVGKKSVATKTPRPRKKRKSDGTPSSELPSRKSTRSSKAFEISYAGMEEDENPGKKVDREGSTPTLAGRLSGNLDEEAESGENMSVDGDEKQGSILSTEEEEESTPVEADGMVGQLSPSPTTRIARRGSTTASKGSTAAAVASETAKSKPSSSGDSEIGTPDSEATPAPEPAKRTTSARVSQKNFPKANAKETTLATSTAAKSRPRRTRA